MAIDESELTYKDFAVLMRSLKLVSFGFVVSSVILVAVGYLGLFVRPAEPNLTFPVIPMQVYGGTMLILACVLRFVWLGKISPRLGFSAQEGQLQQRRASFFDGPYNYLCSARMFRNSWFLHRFRNARHHHTIVAR